MRNAAAKLLQNLKKNFDSGVKGLLSVCRLYVGNSWCEVCRRALPTTQFLINHEQRVQNTAAILLTVKKRREYIRLIITSPHSLPVHFRVNFNVRLIVFKGLNGMALSYVMWSCGVELSEAFWYCSNLYKTHISLWFTAVAPASSMRM